MMISSRERFLLSGCVLASLNPRLRFAPLAFSPHLAPFSKQEAKQKRNKIKTEAKQKQNRSNAEANQKQNRSKTKATQKQHKSKTEATQK